MRTLAAILAVGAALSVQSSAFADPPLGHWVIERKVDVSAVSCFWRAGTALMDFHSARGDTNVEYEFPQGVPKDLYNSDGDYIGTEQIPYIVGHWATTPELTITIRCSSGEYWELEHCQKKRKAQLTLQSSGPLANGYISFAQLFKIVWYAQSVNERIGDPTYDCNNIYW